MAAALNRVIREATALGQSFAAAVAAKVGLSPGDLDYLEIIGFRGRLTAGELAAATGLTTGAITGIVDRLEKAGFVRRERDRDDRRRVFVVAEPIAVERAALHYRALAKAIDRLTATYTDKDVALLLDYFTKSRDVVSEEIRKLTSASDSLSSQ